MLTNIFESRNKTFLNLVKLGDYLGRSLRESVELFSVDGDTVTYLTESKYVIRGNYKSAPLSLTQIEVDYASIFEDKNIYNKLVDKKISGLLADLLENDLSDAKSSFDGVLGLWESKLQFEKVNRRLTDKAQKFDESFRILSTPEFGRLEEMKGELVKALKENKDLALSPEIRSTVRLSSVISKSFDLPRINIEKLAEDRQYSIPSTLNSTLYDHLCKQEIIAKELLESKQSLDTIWITNEKIQKLPSYIYESNDNIMQLVAEIVNEVPYFAMATKKQISSLVEGNLDLLVDDNRIPDKDIKGFVAKIFEFKKPVKNHLTSLLNEKYGVNVQTLTATPTFDSLIKTQSFIFECLSRIAPKNSNMNRVLVEFAHMLKEKSGIESIDVSDFLTEVFDLCEYSTSLTETSLLNYLNFEKVADDLGKIGQVLKMIQAGAGGGDAAGALAAAAQGMGQEVPEGEGEYETDGGELAGMGDEDGEMQGGEEDMEPAMDAEAAANEVGAEEEMEGMEGEEGDMGMGEEGDEMGEEGDEMGEEGDEEGEVEFSDKDDLIDNLKELEELISTLKSDLDLGGDEGMEGMEGEEEMEGMEDEEEEGDMPDIDTGEGEDEVHIDVDSHNDGEEDDSEEEMPKKKKKSKKPEME
jgi:hypothetical protein